ncbi:hypothetical protein FAGKG844_20097 [Frankia sp. AgKG'84/4]
MITSRRSDPRFGGTAGLALCVAIALLCRIQLIERTAVPPEPFSRSTGASARPSAVGGRSFAGVAAAPCWRRRERWRAC